MIICPEFCKLFSAPETIDNMQIFFWFKKGLELRVCG